MVDAVISCCCCYKPLDACMCFVAAHVITDTGSEWCWAEFIV